MVAGLSTFGLRVPESIRFGRGTAADALPAIRRFGSRVFVVHGRSPGRIAWLTDTLRGSDLAIGTFGATGEPDVADLDAALEAARAFRPDVVVGCGGGSALDLAKAVAALVPAEGAPLDYLEVIGAGRSLTADPLPLVAIPTTAGTGAEATKNAVIGSPAHGRKVSLRDDRMVARVALVDPALTDRCPLPVTLACGLDALTQVIEPYLSTRANPVTDALCRMAIPMGFDALAALATGAEDAAARDAMALVSLTGGMALANAGLGAVHGLAGPLGGLTGAPHGAICGALLPHAIDRNRAALLRSGQAVDRIDEVLSLAQEKTGQSLAGFVASCHARGVPRLSQMGVDSEGLQEIAAQSLGSSSMKSNPVDLAPEDLVGLMTDAL